jgi:glyoxylase-like metal-dependent hydrolase (beta-lactamase superfamily II)
LWYDFINKSSGKEGKRMNITFLGTAAAEGFPAVFCNCGYCREARRLGGKNIRTRSQTLINDDLLIDLPADTYSHFLYNGICGDTIRNLLITHSHADHVGGNRYLQEQTGCKIYARGIECDVTNHPLLEPSSLFGASPIKELKNKFLMAQESCAEYLTPQMLPQGFEMIELGGHSYDMVGFRTPDGTVYLADCLSSRETIDKYKISFLYDVGEYIKTLEKVKTLEGVTFVPSHGLPCEDITDLAQYNIDKTLEIGDSICALCTQGLTFEELLQKLFEGYELTMTVEQYALVGGAVKAYLSWLKAEGRMTFEIENNRLIWKTV